MKFKVKEDNYINLYENLLFIYVKFKILLNIFTINRLQKYRLDYKLINFNTNLVLLYKNYILKN